MQSKKRQKTFFENGFDFVFLPEGEETIVNGQLLS
tara:strand:+ start:202 stop:306 length:105 start_codon:yes stop_codon:yes gene_type:complete